jgi:hypothetical protein
MEKEEINNEQTTIQLQENEYNEASSIEKKTRMQILMEGKTFCSLKIRPNEEQHPNEIKKIQLKSPLVDYEWSISQKIQAIPNTDIYFQTILKEPTQINIGEFTEDNIETCNKMHNKNNSANTQELVTITYKRREPTTTMPLIYYIKNLKNEQSEYFFMTILDTFDQLIHTIKKIQSIPNPIILFDIHNESILYDKVNAVPILSDNKMAIEKSDIDNPEKRRELIPQYELPYPTISIEIWLLSNIIEIQTQYTKETVIDWIDQYAKFSIQTPRLAKFIEEYKQSLQNVESWEQLETELVQSSNTWDIYAIATIYQTLCSQIIDLRTKYQFLEEWFQLLESILYSIPKSRPSLTQIIEELNKFTTFDRELYHSFMLEVLTG